MRSDQRQHPRLACEGTAEVQLLEDSSGVSARILDLSVEGCLVELDSPLPLKQGLSVEITFTVMQLPFRVRAEVRALRAAQTIGFKFPMLSARIRSQLEDLIGELDEDHAKRQANLKTTASRRSHNADT